MSDVRKYIVTEPWSTEEYPNGRRLCLRVDHQTFTISSGDGDSFEPERAEWMAAQLAVALKRMVDQLK